MHLGGGEYGVYTPKYTLYHVRHTLHYLSTKPPTFWTVYASESVEDSIGEHGITQSLTVTRLWARWLANCGLISSRGRGSPFLQSVRTYPGFYPGCMQFVSAALPSTVKYSSITPLSAEVKNRMRLTSTSPYSFTAWYLVIFFALIKRSFFLTCIQGDSMLTSLNPYPTAFPYGNGMVLHFYQQQESSTTKTVHKVINKGLKTYI